MTGRHARWAATAVAAVALLAGCGSGGGTGHSGRSGGDGGGHGADGAGYSGVLAPVPTPTTTGGTAPAAAAGGSCTLLDYDGVRQATGTRFGAAAAGADGAVRSCALQVLYAEHPDLVLSVAPTKVDAKGFAKAAPSGSSAVSGLGSAAYGQVGGAQGGAGPVVTVAWLGKGAQIVTLRYTFAAGVPASQANPLVAGLTTLGRTVESHR